jgi:MoaA/NifB/PqqE/SkfB family radical SAM enzyme
MANKLYSNYLPEIAALKIRRKGPSAVSLNLNDRCNQHCIYCEIGKSVQSKSTTKINLEDVEWLIDQMAEANIYRLALNGGEPFLFDHIIRVVEIAGEKGIRCSVSSNGMSIHQFDDHAWETLKKFKTRINISLDSFDAGINDITRGTDGALDNALRSMNRVLNHKIELSLLCVISKYNYKSLFNYVRAAHNIGIKEVLFQPVIYHSNFPDRSVIADKYNLNVDPAETGILIQELDKILMFERKHRIKTNTYRIKLWIGEYLKGVHSNNGHYFFNNILNHFYCRELDSIIEINHDGGLLPCGLGQAKYYIDDIRQEGLICGWNKARKQLQECMKRQEFQPMCNACCHHFSRNMMASIIKHPYRNREALFMMLPPLASRLKNNVRKTIHAK